VWTASAAVVEGDPSGLSSVTPYDEWIATDWNHPDLRRDLSIALLEGDTLVSFVKSAALTRSRDASLTDAFTGNDAGNAPMLAVNQWLGYQSTASSWTAGKTL
jgi:hypothetical protein